MLYCALLCFAKPHRSIVSNDAGIAEFAFSGRPCTVADCCVAAEGSALQCLQFPASGEIDELSLEIFLGIHFGRLLSKRIEAGCSKQIELSRVGVRRVFTKRSGSQKKSGYKAVFLFV